MVEIAEAKGTQNFKKEVICSRVNLPFGHLQKEFRLVSRKDGPQDLRIR